MNNKRQTIWLVSMLSLMVILSAYYLFTDTDSKTPPVAESTQVDQKGTDANGQGTVDELVVNEVLEEGTDGDSGANEQDGTSGTGAETGTEDPAKATQGDQEDKAAKENEKATEPEVTESKEETKDAKDTSKATDANKTDEEILSEMSTSVQSATAAAQLDFYKMEREQKNNKLYDDLIAKIDNHENKPDVTAQASQQWKEAEEKEAAILSIEELLQQQYGNAVVKEESEKYNVVVLSEKLDAKGAAGIVSMVMKELRVSPDKVTVQYVAP
ncbi:hypothetical protein JCM10914A_38460 [Paenibacillus sp. JCM 10914]|uniref:SpoIIIAH-like family protein n=1 Tax=Paenibacillus sp. JCM 10914 TaxID=1236974 RepID=UPI0003CC6E1E|nr:SpoIIIAH-like family protein [Paenibacillus sp. JCM 10914]GAE04558.1 stage III sporulation protein AH [Paenibacillus sp. JCM 10914]